MPQGRLGEGGFETAQQQPILEYATATGDRPKVQTPILQGLHGLDQPLGNAPMKPQGDHGGGHAGGPIGQHRFPQNRWVEPQQRVREQFDRVGFPIEIQRLVGEGFEGDRRLTFIADPIGPQPQKGRHRIKQPTAGRRPRAV